MTAYEIKYRFGAGVPCAEIVWARSMDDALNIFGNAGETILSVKEA